MLAETGERIGLTGVTRPFSDRRAAERLADALTHLSKPVALPDPTDVKRFADVVLISDFLDPLEDISAWIAQVAEHWCPRSSGAGSRSDRRDLPL